MEHEITTIPLLKVKSGISCDTPSHEDFIITENDPAISVMTDFTETLLFGCLIENCLMKS